MRLFPLPLVLWVQLLPDYTLYNSSSQTKSSCPALASVTLTGPKGERCVEGDACKVTIDLQEVPIVCGPWKNGLTPSWTCRIHLNEFTRELCVSVPLVHRVPGHCLDIPPAKKSSETFILPHKGIFNSFYEVAFTRPPVGTVRRTLFKRRASEL